MREKKKVIRETKSIYLPTKRESRKNQVKPREIHSKQLNRRVAKTHRINLERFW